MNRVFVVFKRQLASYLSTPATYLSIAAFLLLSSTLGLQASHWLEQTSSNLQPFFQWHPWLYLLLIPALSTQLWGDEHATGYVDFLKTMPLTAAELVIGKFFAAWFISALALVLTSPVLIVINLLGTVDNMIVASQFFASWMLAGCYLSVGCFVCALAHQRLPIFLWTLALLLIASSLTSILDSLEHQAPIWIIDSLTSLSPFLRFAMIDNGVLVLQDCLYFISMIIAFLAATIVFLNYKNS